MRWLQHWFFQCLGICFNFFKSLTKATYILVICYIIFGGKLPFLLFIASKNDARIVVRGGILNIWYILEKVCIFFMFMIRMKVLISICIWILPLHWRHSSAFMIAHFNCGWRMFYWYETTIVGVSHCWKIRPSDAKGSSYILASIKLLFGLYHLLSL